MDIIDRYGPEGLSKLVRVISDKAVNFQSGYLYHYAFVMLIGVTFFILIVGLWDIIAPWWDSRLLVQFIATSLLFHYYSN